MIYKTLYLKNNPNAEYQRRNGVWYKRKIGSKEMWYKVEQNGQQTLNNVYQGKSPLFFYSNLSLFAGALVLGYIGYWAYKKYKSKQTVNI
jgi:hypothetical protein